VYVVLGRRYDLPIFAHIADSETRHQSAVSSLLDRYRIDDPTDDIDQLLDGSITLSGYIENVVRPILPAEPTRKVDAATNWDLQLRYDGLAGWRLAGGVRNLLDAEPPFSQTSSFQFGFNPLVSSPLGRTFYLRATYALK